MQSNHAEWLLRLCGQYRVRVGEPSARAIIKHHLIAAVSGADYCYVNL